MIKNEWTRDNIESRVQEVQDTLGRIHNPGSVWAKDVESGLVGLTFDASSYDTSEGIPTLLYFENGDKPLQAWAVEEVYGADVYQKPMDIKPGAKVPLRYYWNMADKPYAPYSQVRLHFGHTAYISAKLMADGAREGGVLSVNEEAIDYWLALLNRWP